MNRVSLKQYFIIPTLLISLTALFISFHSSKVLSEEGNNGVEITMSVMKYLERYYVDKARINPREMFLNGMNRLERTLDEVLVYFPNDVDSKTFTIKVSNEEKTFDYTDVINLDSIIEKMDNVFQFISPRIKTKEPTIREVEYAVLDEMLKTLDSHSGIITPQVYKEFMIETEGSFGGLGIVIGLRDGELTVISPIEGTPAYRAGIKPNDKIVQIENESTINMSLIEAVSKLRGKKGSPVNIHIKRESLTEPKEFVIVRDTIKIESVESFDLGDNIIYMRIRDFQKNTLDSVHQNLSEYGNEIGGLILDLRGNPGGLLDQAEKVSDLFLKEGVIVTTQIGDSKKRYNAQQKSLDYNGNVIVLVDSGSASASEIVAGALKNNERAAVIGERTFGKGSVQQIFDLKDGSALKLTIAQYLTPGDISIQDTGITPDISLNPAIISEDKVVFKNKPNENRENPKDKEIVISEKPLYSITYLEPINEAEDDSQETKPEEAMTKQEKLERLNNDFYITVAKKILKSSTKPTRKESLDKAKNEIKKLSTIEEQKIQNRWKDLGIDWTLGKSSNNSTLEVNLEPSSVNLKAGEKTSISIQIENKGNEPIYRLSAISNSENTVLEGKEFIFGKIDPGEKKKWITAFEIPKWMLSREDMVTLKFKDGSDNKYPDYKFMTQIERLPRPAYAFSYEILHDGANGPVGNGNADHESGEDLLLKVLIKNIGKGSSEKTIATIKNLSGESVFIKNGRATIDNLSPGNIAEATFSYTVKNKDEIKLELQIADEVFREGLISKINIPEDNQYTNPNEGPIQVVVTLDQTPIRGGKFEEAPVVGYAEKGKVFNTIDKDKEWIKVELGNSLSGWISKDNILFTSVLKQVINNQSSEHTFQSAPEINITKMPLSTKTNLLSIYGTIVDSDKVELVSVFVGNDKVVLIPSDNVEVPLSVIVKLKEEITLITVVAKDSNGLQSKKSFVIRKEG